MLKSVMLDKYEVFEYGIIINTLNGKEMAQRIKDKHKEVRLTLNGIRKNFITSRLVYWLFNDNFDIDNKDLCIVAEDLINFTLSDLKVVNRKDLIQGEKHKNVYKLTNEQVAEIKSLYIGKTGVNQHTKTGMSYSDIAKKYGVTRGLIASIIRGEIRNENSYKLK